MKVKLGPRGRNVVLERSYGAPTVTKDGELRDRLENMCAQMVRQVAVKTSDIAGDGATTATAQAIVREGMEYVASGLNPMDLKRGIDLATAAIVEELRKLSLAVTTSREIPQVGTISANADEEIGRIIADAMDKVSKDGAATARMHDGRACPDALATH